MVTFTFHFGSIIEKCRGLRRLIKQSHSAAVLFEKYQNSIGSNVTIVSDVPTRFDSTLDMIHSVLKNQQVLQSLQHREWNFPGTWSTKLHISPDEFTVMENIVILLRPVRHITKRLSSEQVWIGDVLPILSSSIEEVKEIPIASSASALLQSALIESLTQRLQMLLDTNRTLPINGVPKMGLCIPTEFVVPAYLHPNYCLALEGCYGYNQKCIVDEMKRLHELHIGDICADKEIAEEVASEVETNILSSRLDAWKVRYSQRSNAKHGNRGFKRNVLRKEFLDYKSVLPASRNQYCDSRKFWGSVESRERMPHLSPLAMLFLTVPASAIPQERQFSELKRRCAGLRNRSKIETLDRDAVVYEWDDDVY